MADLLLQDVFKDIFANYAHIKLILPQAPQLSFHILEWKSDVLQLHEGSVLNDTPLRETDTNEKKAKLPAGFEPTSTN